MRRRKVKAQEFSAHDRRQMRELRAAARAAGVRKNSPVLACVLNQSARHGTRMRLLDRLSDLREAGGPAIKCKNCRDCPLTPHMVYPKRSNGRADKPRTLYGAGLDKAVAAAYRRAAAARNGAKPETPPEPPARAKRPPARQQKPRAPQPVAPAARACGAGLLQVVLV